MFRFSVAFRNTIIVLGVCISLPAFAQSFSDVSSDNPNADAIAYVKAQGIVSGYSDGTFKPTATINRAEFVKILAGAHLQWINEEQKKYPNGPFFEDSECIAVFGNADISMPFSDVLKTDWFARSACLASSQRLMDGYPDGTFRPANIINFAEAAKIIANHYLITQGKNPPETQSDPWYQQYVQVLADAHAIPTSIRSFDQDITRGEMAEMIYRLDANVTNKQSTTYDQLVSASSNDMMTFTDPERIYSITYPASWFNDIGNDVQSVDGVASFQDLSTKTKFTVGIVTSSVVYTCPNIQPSPGTIVQTVQIDGHDFKAVETIGTDHFGSSVDTITFMSQLSTSECLVLTKNITTGITDEKTTQDQALAQQEQSQLQNDMKSVIKSVQILPHASLSHAADWQTYSGNGYWLQYPNGWTAQENVSFSSVYGENDPVIAADQKGIVLTLGGSRSLTSMLQDEFAFITIAPSCPDLSQNFVPSQNLSGGHTVVINGQTFATAYASDGAAGSVGETWYYASPISASQCLVLFEHYFHGTTGPYDQPARTQVQQEIAAEYDKLNQIVQSIQIP